MAVVYMSSRWGYKVFTELHPPAVIPESFWPWLQGVTGGGAGTPWGALPISPFIAPSLLTVQEVTCTWHRRTPRRWAAQLPAWPATPSSQTQHSTRVNEKFTPFIITHPTLISTTQGNSCYSLYILGLGLDFSTKFGVLVHGQDISERDFV